MYCYSIMVASMLRSDLASDSLKQHEHIKKYMEPVLFSLFTVRGIVSKSVP